MMADAERRVTERISLLEGTATDLRSIPFIGPIMLFMRGAKAVWTSGSFDSTASLDIASLSTPSTGVITATFKNQRVDAKYQVVVDFESPNIGNMVKVAKTTSGFTVSILSGSGAGSGMAFNPLTPLNAVFTVLGGR